MIRARNARWAKRRIKELWDEGTVEFATHALLRLEQRGLDANDVQHVLRYGAVTRMGPSGFPDTPERCVLEGEAVDGDQIARVVDINGSLIVVTAYPKK